MFKHAPVLQEYTLPMVYARCTRSRSMQAKNWLPMFFLCGFAAVVYLGFGFAAISYSIKSIVDNSKTFGVFAR